MSGFTINNVNLSGNLTRDPELRSTQSGTSVCSLRIASNDRFKSLSGEWEDRPNYFSITVWKGMGEWVANNLHKGDAVVVSGRLTWREWTAQDGGKREAVEITADSVVPVPRDGDGGGGGSRDGGSGFAQHTDVPADAADFAPASPSRGSSLPPRGSGGSPPLPVDDDIPF
jgi:single-strand DNA-binding protein